MELSPASPNVVYWLCYPKSSLLESGSFPAASQISRSAAADVVAGGGVWPTLDITLKTPFEETDVVSVDPQFQMLNAFGGMQEYPPDSGIEVWSYLNVYLPYSLGGTASAYDHDGGVNSWMIEVTSNSPLGVYAKNEDDYGALPGMPVGLAFFPGSGTDGGQYIAVTAIGTQFGGWDPVNDLPLHLDATRIKAWRMKTPIWPDEPTLFWTNFIGSAENI